MATLPENARRMPLFYAPGHGAQKKAKANRRNNARAGSILDGVDLGKVGLNSRADGAGIGSVLDTKDTGSYAYGGSGT